MQTSFGNFETIVEVAALGQILRAFDVVDR